MDTNRARTDESTDGAAAERAAAEPATDPAARQDDKRWRPGDIAATADPAARQDDKRWRTGDIAATADPAARQDDKRWRTVDIVVTAVVSVACGAVFVGWASVYSAASPLFATVAPLTAVLAGTWFLPGVLAPLLVRKPGAALFAELAAALVSVVFGSPWGLLTLVSGVVQGLGAEVVFAATRYRRFGLGVAMLAGAGAGLAAAVSETFLYYLGYSFGWILLRGVAEMIGGALLAGLGAWLLARALAKTGVLDAVAGGRRRERV